jgi:hypothetical protein
LIDVFHHPHEPRGSADLAGARAHAEPAPAQAALDGGDRAGADAPSLKPIIERLEGGEFDAAIILTRRYFRSFQLHPIQREKRS